MSAANFQSFMDFIWNPQRDGADNDSAPGETWVTRFGCTSYTWDYAVNHGIVKGTLAKASKPAITSVFHSLFWNVVRGDSLPGGLDVLLAEQATLAGTGTAAKVLQRIVKTTADGVIGPKTLAAIAKRPLGPLLDLQSVAFLDYLRRLPTWRTFANGWSTREREALALAHRLAGV